MRDLFTGSVWRKAFTLRGVVIGLAAMMGTLAAGEMFARYGLGLGDPPLYQPHERIGYLNQPGEYHRFGNHVAYNRYGMRSEDFGIRRTSSDELRVLMIGDSVLNGGALTDQAETASARLKARLSSEFAGPVVVGNVSVGGWSPVNMAAYVREFGFFDADVVVFVLSSHDYAAAEPTLPQSVDFPTRSPGLALVEGFERYVPRYVDRFASRATAEAQSQSAAENAIAKPAEADIERATAAVRQMIRDAKRNGATVLVAQHLTSEELEHGPKVGHEVIGRVAREAGAELIPLRDGFEQAIASGLSPYRDDIHPNPDGQRLIAEALEPHIAHDLRVALADRLARETVAGLDPLGSGRLAN